MKLFIFDALKGFLSGYCSRVFKCSIFLCFAEIVGHLNQCSNQEKYRNCENRII